MKIERIEKGVYRVTVGGFDVVAAVLMFAIGRELGAWATRAIAGGV